MTEDNGRKETQILITVSRSLNPQILRRKKKQKGERGGEDGDDDDVKRRT